MTAFHWALEMVHPVPVNRQLVHLDVVHLALVDSADLGLDLEALAMAAHSAQQRLETEIVAAAAVGLAIVVSVVPDAIKYFKQNYYSMIFRTFPRILYTHWWMLRWRLSGLL